MSTCVNDTTKLTFTGNVTVAPGEEPGETVVDILSSSGGLTHWQEGAGPSYSSFTPINSDSSADAAILPKGSGALVTKIALQSGTPLAARGPRAVDLQMYQTAANQVAGSLDSAMLGGWGNRIQSDSSYSVIIGGAESVINEWAPRSAIVGGSNNTLGGQGSGSYSSTFCNIFGTGSGALNTAGGNIGANGSYSNILASGSCVISGGGLSTSYDLIAASVSCNISTITPSQGSSGNHAILGSSQINANRGVECVVAASQLVATKFGNNHAAIATRSSNIGQINTAFIGGSTSSLIRSGTATQADAAVLGSSGPIVRSSQSVALASRGGDSGLVSGVLVQGDTVTPAWQNLTHGSVEANDADMPAFTMARQRRQLTKSTATNLSYAQLFDIPPNYAGVITGEIVGVSTAGVATGYAVWSVRMVIERGASGAPVVESITLTQTFTKGTTTGWTHAFTGVASQAGTTLTNFIRWVASGSTAFSCTGTFTALEHTV